MVPTKHHTTEHSRSGMDGLCTRITVHHLDWARNPCRQLWANQPTHRVDCARTTGYGSTAHRYDCAPRSLNAVSVVKTERRLFVHWNDSTRLIGHDSIVQKYNWAPARLCMPPFFEYLGTGKFSTKLIVHYRVSTVQLHTNAIVHRVDWARAQLCTVSTGHEYRCTVVPLQLSTMAYLCRLFQFFFECLFSILSKNGRATSVALLKIYFRSTGEFIDAKSFVGHKQSFIIRASLNRCFDKEKL